MKMPQAAKPQFDRLLTTPLQKINTHKKQIEILQESISEDPLAVEIVGTVAALLNRVERKTSPLYVRLIHAAVLYVSADAVDWPLTRDVISAVAHSTKNFDLVMA
ncbi:MAG: hypothetical protein P8R54_33090 [Myxococcota bacterium]|nr:hypothetical protein [Myxococcota bacterium]